MSKNVDPGRDPALSCTAFAGGERVAAGRLQEVALICKVLLDAGESRPVYIFDDATAKPVEVDFRGSAEEVAGRLVGGPHLAVEPAVNEAQDEEAKRRGPGRPKLGVVGREVTLLPRHWDWLNAQPGGASVALRKLVEQARRLNGPKDRIRQSREIAFRFMSTMAGDEPGFEEAIRALFAGSRSGFEANTALWPKDVREYAARLAGEGLHENAP